MKKSRTCEYEIPPLIAASIIFERHIGICERTRQSVRDKDQALDTVKSDLLVFLSAFLSFSI